MHKKIILNFLNFENSAQGYEAIICPFDLSFLQNVFFNYSEVTGDADRWASAFQKSQKYLKYLMFKKK